MSTKEAQQKIVENMQTWQKIENASVASTGAVIEKTDNPLVRLVMEVIQRDSQMHYRVQELIADSLSTKAIALSTDELADIWDLIEKHIALEAKTIEMAKDSLEATEGIKGMLVQRYLLEYLLNDEEKHNTLLAKLEAFKTGMYPYA
jgi:uncharacterized protein YoaH (UPF0181 family)